MAGLIADITEMRTYVKAMLGYPQIDVEITDDQLEWAIQEAIEEFSEYAGSGATLKVMTLPLVEGQMSYILDNNVYDVTRIFNQNAGTIISSVFPDQVMADFTAGSMLRSSGSLLSYELGIQQLEAVHSLVDIPYSFVFNTTTKELILSDQRFMSETEAAILYYERIDSSSQNVYNELWIKKYSIASARYYWGTNLIKYDGSLLPEGMTLNASAILDIAEKEKDELKTELYEVHMTPSKFFIG